MFKMQKVIYLAICLKLILAFPPLQNENEMESSEQSIKDIASIFLSGSRLDFSKFNINDENSGENKDNFETSLDKKEKSYDIFKEQFFVKSIEEQTTPINIVTSDFSAAKITTKHQIKNSTENPFADMAIKLEPEKNSANDEHEIKNSTGNKTEEIKTNLEHENVDLNTKYYSTENTPALDNTSTIKDLELTTLPTVESDINTGQLIKLVQSKSEEGNQINPAGVEILQNISRVCGTLLGKRISFGQPTTLMEFPWTALLLYNTRERYHCGGTLITERYVLTAAHCVAQDFYELTAVRLGEHDITTEKDCAEDVGGDLICTNTIDVNVIKIIVHHEYSHKTQTSDIALLRLERMLETSRSYFPICLPRANENVLDQKQGIVAGWGATEQSVRSNILVKAEVPILDMSKCREVYRYTKFNDTTQLCGSGATEVDVCKGDSGGAIFYETSGRKRLYIQLGIISQGVRRCGDNRFLPAVFTKLDVYVKWIENNLEY